MRMTTRMPLSIAALSTVSLLAGMATAQDADLQAQVEEVQQRYEEAVAAGDYEALASLFAGNVLYSPLPGGIIEGPEEAAGFYEQNGVKALDLRSSRTEMLGEDVVLDLGTFTATLPGEGGDMQVEGEYVTLAEIGENGLRIRSVTAFPMRQAPDAAAEQ